MKIEHVAMYVKNMEEARDFFITYFGGASSEIYYNPNTGFRSYFISFADGARLEIMNKPEVVPDAALREKMGYAHIAFSVGSREKVDSLTEQLGHDGYCITSGPRLTGDGYYESCVMDNEGNIIEITV